MEREKISANCTSDKRIISRIFKELPQINKTKCQSGSFTKVKTPQQEEHSTLLIRSKEVNVKQPHVNLFLARETGTDKGLQLSVLVSE